MDLVYSGNMEPLNDVVSLIDTPEWGPDVLNFGGDFTELSDSVSVTDTPLLEMSKGISRRGSGYRKGVQEAVAKKAPLDDSGNMRCLGCDRIMDNDGDDDDVTNDHYPTWSERTQTREHESRRQWLDDWNNIEELRPLCCACNSGYQYEHTPTKKLP